MIAPMNYCYLNGYILQEDKAKVGILDIGLLRGFGIYEAMTVVHDKIFRAEDHIGRFRKSADFLKMQVPLSNHELEQTIFALMEKNGLKDARINVKCILTGGNALGGIDYNGAQPTFYIFLEEWKPIDPKYYAQGASVIVREHLRQYPEYKTTNYLTTTLLQKEMRQADALEILYVWKNNVLECATSNFFMVKDGILVTAQDNILAGVTRNVVLELARAHGVPVEEREYTLDELCTADEAFLTSSFKDIVPVVKVGGTTIADGLVGGTTKTITRLFAEYLRAF